MSELPELPPDQQEFKLNDVCKLANVQPYMLRFWGTEFPQLEAGKTGTGQRLYTRDQVKLILRIRELLFDEGLTIAGARKRVAAEDPAGAAPDSPPAAAEPAPPAKSPPASEAPRASDPPARTRAERPPLRGLEPPPEPVTPDPRLQRAHTALRHVRDELSGIVAGLKKTD